MQCFLGLQKETDLTKRDYRRLGRLLFGAKALQHRLGKRARQHAADATGQYEASATLIASGAQLELRNCRGSEPRPTVPRASLSRASRRKD